MPPKSTETFSIASRAMSGSPRELAHEAPEPLRHQNHDDDEQEAKHQARRVLDPAQELGDHDIEGGAHDRAADGAEAADHHHAEEGDRQGDVEAFRVDVAHEI